LVPIAECIGGDLSLPPPFDVFRLREHENAFAVACRRAAECGAGSLFTVGRFDLLEFAVVLEPAEPLRTARLAFFVGMNALAATIGALAPPQKPVNFAWPDAIHFDRACLGGARLGWPAECAEDAVPEWLVFSPMLTASKMLADDTGLTPDSTSLEQESFDGGDLFLSIFARHLMFGLDQWAEDGFAYAARTYLDKIMRARAGDTVGLDGNGDLLIDNPVRKAAPERYALLEGLRKVEWFDPARGSPRL
jgi:hypothetical protein